MPIPANASVKQQSYTVEALYREAPHGVFLLMTSGLSTARGGYPEFWDVYALLGARVVDALPFRYDEWLLIHSSYLFFLFFWKKTKRSI